METALAVIAGGALGSLARYVLANLIGGNAGHSFPWGIFTINVLGSAIMGLLIGLFAARGNPPQAMRAFLTTGFLGGFTTFSTFSLDTATLIQRGAYGLAGLYAAGSVGAGVLGLFAGMSAARLVAA